MMTAAHRQNRLQWCLEDQNYDWSKVVFTDDRYGYVGKQMLLHDIRISINTF